MKPRVHPSRPTGLHARFGNPSRRGVQISTPPDLIGALLSQGHTTKAVYSTGVLNRFGGDVDLFSVGYQHNWGR